MSKSLKKIDKEFVLSDSSVNVYGYRMLTAGWQREEFEKNPIGFYLHGETEEHPRSQGVLVRWDDIRIQGDCIYGKPVINLSHPRGQQTVDEIESSFLNGASFGDMVVLDCADLPDPSNPEQTILTLTKWYNKECSVVPMPGNRNAFAVPKLYDASGSEIPNLSDFHNSKNPPSDMKSITLPITAALVALLNLSDDGKNATDKDINAAIQNLADRANTAEKKVTTLESDKTTLEREVTNLKDTAITAEVSNLCDTGVKEGRFTQALSDVYRKQYAKDPAGLKAVYDATPQYKSVVDNLQDKGDKTAARIKNLSDKPWDELDRSGGLAELRSLSEEAYVAKYEERFGKKPNA